MKKILFAAVLAGAAVFTACGNKGGVQMGSLSKFDSLSYALGISIGSSMSRDMRNIPFDIKSIDKGIKESAMGESPQKHEEAIEVLRDYFVNKHGQRAQAIAAEYAKEDSTRLANGDSTKVERPEADARMFETEKERKEISYAFGNDLGYNLSQSGIPVQVVWVGQALQDLRDGNAKMTVDKADQLIRYYFQVQRPAENAAASKAWLEKIEKKSGVKKTESGLLYKVNEPGDQNVMAKDKRDVVKVHYTGRTRDGKVFDTSHFANRSEEQKEMMRKYNPGAFDEKGNPKEADKEADFPLNQVIPGWTEGLQLVGKGGTITLWIPSDLAYGPRGMGRDIGPNEALEFEVELIDVIPYEEPAPADSTAAAAAPAPEK